MLTEKTLAAQNGPFVSQLYLMMSVTAGKGNTDVTVIGMTSQRLLHVWSFKVEHIETGCQLYDQGVESTHIYF